MTPLFRPRDWRGPSLAMQILALLLGGLVVAQLVTLLLTFVLPPAPPVRYDLRDIANALRAAPRGGLRRTVQTEPPATAGRGWLVAASSRDDLARLLGADRDAVRLSFYTPLPFAGTTAPHLAAPPVDTVPARPLALAPTAFGEPDDGNVPARLIHADYVVLAQASPGHGGLPGGRPSGFPGGGLPGRGFPGNGFPGEGSPRGVPDAGFPRPSPSRPTAAPPATVPNVRTAPTPAADPAASSRPSAQSIPSRTVAGPWTQTVPPPSLPASAPPRQTPDIVGPRWAIPIGPPSSVAMPAPDAPAPVDAPAPRQPETRRPADTPSRSTAEAVAAPAPDPAPPVAPGIPASRSARAPSADADIDTAAAQREVAPAPAGLRGMIDRARSFLGLAPPAFVEGDFVAAWRLPDGSWAVVQPPAARFLSQWQRRVLLWFAIAFAIVAPVGWLFAQRLSRPLDRFADAAARLGRDPSAVIAALDGPAEIGRAAHAFNQMQNRLRAFVDDRTAMVGAISHDLRTPLTRLRFRIEDAHDDIRDGMLLEVAEMEQMISSVLAFIRDASTPGVRERLDLRTLVDDAAENAAMIGGDVVVESEVPATVEVDVLGMRRVLANLIENAIKYGARARVRLSVEDGEAVASVIDDGPGLPDAELEQVFQPFYRTAAARASSTPGTGLGLAVCRSIARAHGGDVRLSRSHDGFVAEVRVPLAYDGERMLAA